MGGIQAFATGNLVTFLRFEVLKLGCDAVGIPASIFRVKNKYSIKNVNDIRQGVVWG
jgi:hypothetical protein